MAQKFDVEISGGVADSEDQTTECLPQNRMVNTMTKVAVMRALRDAQMAWGLNQAWGNVDGSANTDPAPSLTEEEIDTIACRAEEVFGHIIAGEHADPVHACALGKSEKVVRFSRQKKRGAKVRTGPCAALLSFPSRSAAPRLTGEDLLSEWAWIRRNHDGWNNEELSGRSKREVWEKLYFQQAGRASINGRPLPDGDSIRREIAECRAIIEKRVRIKDWLETRGANWDEVKTPEQALFFVFDHLHAQVTPESA